MIERLVTFALRQRFLIIVVSIALMIRSCPLMPIPICRRPMWN